jgi:hypothetical protein
MRLDLVLPKPPDLCYRAFCDVASSRLWVPGLKKVRIVRTDAEGRAVEVSYERRSLTYALVYAYDGVSGRAEFTPHEGGCLFSYELDSQRGRGPEHHGEVARAFAVWVSTGSMP